MAGILDLFSLDGKIAWVTGASYGLGMAYAMAFAEAGAKVVFNSSNEERVKAAIREYKDAGFDVYGAVCDVTDEKEVAAFVSDVEDKFGTIDILVNNAGIIKRIPMTEMSLDEWNSVINVDLTGPFICSKAVIPAMIRKGGGKIINACSMMSEFGRETVSAYAAAKGGLKMLTRNICSEYGQYNIQCNGIGPGYIATPQTAPLRKRGEDGSINPFDRFIRSKTPAQRWGHTDELKGLAVFLASPASDFINGQVIYIDGGISAYIGQDPGNLDGSKFEPEEE
ncbi:MAG: gluconate 5-dehydrogenase [Lachnospiraceae bacterium]|nr:gluconate 5-dehydrogenase [Lachnospiraceae bacterium]